MFIIITANDKKDFTFYVRLLITFFLEKFYTTALNLSKVAAYLIQIFTNSYKKLKIKLYKFINLSMKILY
jgi:hypothetical protein